MWWQSERASTRSSIHEVSSLAVNFERMLQAVIANGGAADQMVFWSRPVNWKDQALTPNPNTIYFNPFYDTTKGPVVLEIPPVEGEPSITGSIDDAWQCALADVGPAGVDQGKGGKYLITPPGYKETLPGGYIVVPSDTYQGFAILRSNFESGSDADIAAAVAYRTPTRASLDDRIAVMKDLRIPYGCHLSLTNYWARRSASRVAAPRRPCCSACGNSAMAAIQSAALGWFS